MLFEKCIDSHFQNKDCAFSAKRRNIQFPPIHDSQLKTEYECHWSGIMFTWNALHYVIRQNGSVALFTGALMVIQYFTWNRVETEHHKRLTLIPVLSWWHRFCIYINFIARGEHPCGILYGRLWVCGCEWLVSCCLTSRNKSHSTPYALVLLAATSK